MFTSLKQQLVAIMCTCKMLILDRPYIDLVEYQRKLEACQTLFLCLSPILHGCGSEMHGGGGRSDSLPMHSLPGQVSSSASPDWFTTAVTVCFELVSIVMAMACASSSELHGHTTRLTTVDRLSSFR